MAPQREWFEKDYYAVLGVPSTSTAKEITRAYRKLARENHPDTNPGNKAAEDRFKELSAAYDVLGDENKRKEYDEVRRMGPMGGAFGGAGPHFEDVGDLSDLFANFFGAGGGGAGGRGRQRRGSGPQRGADLDTELTLSFDEAAKGLTTSVHLSSDVSCPTCHGTGAAPGSKPIRCSACGGRGVTDDNQGFFSFTQPCTQCKGTGNIVIDPCHPCRGTGVQRKSREIKVRIPGGVDDGQRIRLAGRGGPGRNGGPDGDLFILVHVKPHDLFGRVGRNLTIEVPITFAEAALGAAIRVPTLDGEAVAIRIPAGTNSGRTFRVKGRGIQEANATGDLLVTVDVLVPTRLSMEQKAAIEALAASDPVSPRSYLGV